MSLEATAFGCAKWSIRSKRFAVLGCLKNELAGRSVEKLNPLPNPTTTLCNFSPPRSFFPSDDACRKALRGIGLRHTPFTEEASLLAGRIFRTYRDEGGARKTILPDFLVAAHAATQADSLATEDRGYLRSYFPAVRLLTVDRS